MKQEMSPLLLKDLLKAMQRAYDACVAQDVARLAENVEHSTMAVSDNSCTLPSHVVHFAMRFPVAFWEDALDFLEKNK